jgi:cytosine/adenosine deaminase-related metal-dependent hydrolase
LRSVAGVVLADASARQPHRDCDDCGARWQGPRLRNTRIVIENGTIVALDPKAGPVDYDLRGLTVLPGWIDAHVLDPAF